MTVMNTSYREGELLTVNCTTQPSKTMPTLTFYINNRALPKDVVRVWEGGAMLETKLKRSDFSPRGELRLKCVASVMGLYNISSGSIAIWLEHGKPFVLGAEDASTTGSKNSAENGFMSLGMMMCMYCIYSVQFMEA
ncbi:hypothetical protein L798_14208 [Zootermopsis nevadensis]|uniref:Ig-like domain-containing protein n=2 Tax=Zootermopsis nevadensis TaxID=136037 RepID=A0A067R2I2_ZOONE|nr:hypothetical protein L798_14208 [Zootermopsis nevadensis]